MTNFGKLRLRSMPDKSRFGLNSWFINQEECYTEEELQFRDRVLVLRKHSKIDKELLQTDSTWFMDKDQAMETINADSWVLQKAWRPKQRLSRDDFHIDLIQRQTFKWEGIDTLSRTIGDYLLLRNNQLEDTHLNQPMNYIFIDLSQLLKRLAANQEANFVIEQLQLIGSYLRDIETLLSRYNGSDRVFLESCRQEIEITIQEDIEQHVQTQQLKTRIQQINLNLHHIGELRHTVLHFALTAETANPHPYWEYYSHPGISHDITPQFPTFVAQNCQTQHQNLESCAGFQFVEGASIDAKEAYAKGLQDLQHLLHTQTLLQQLLAVFDKAGEIFTILQFREQMMHLLHSIEAFITHSQQHIASVLRANNEIYQQFIQDKQELSWWKSYLSTQPASIDAFINNQDNLARFPANLKSLQQANLELFHQLGATNAYLQQTTLTKQLALADDTREIVRELTRKMQNLLAPDSPKRLIKASEKLQLTRNKRSANPLVSPIMTNQLFWQTTPHKAPRLQVPKIAASANTSTGSNMPLLTIGMMTLIPLALILLFLLITYIYKKRKEDEQKLEPRDSLLPK